MVRDPSRAPSGQPPSQGGQPDRQERHRTHRTGAGEVRTTPSTVGGGSPPTHRGGSSGGGSSEGERPRPRLEVELRLTGWMTPDVVVLDHPMRMIMIHVTVDVVDDLLTLAIATRLAAKYGQVSVQYQNAERRVEIRREKNVMVTNPFGHQGFAGFRARFKKAFGVYPRCDAETVG
ncbi:hypothetical protein R1sor_004251 [Riccia sorocarpa]|uniref:Uncharacterized protein n=1 Tax=Riccia sorocarpa TaxID=122646 RepID=A0ABD3H7W9_9MARC